MQNNFLSCFFGTKFSGINHNVSILRLFIGVRNAGKFFEDTSASFGVKTLAIALLASLHWSCDMHQDEAADGFDHAAYRFSRRVIGSNRSADRDAAVFGNFRRDISDPADVDIAMLLREAQFGGEMLAHQVAIQQ